MTIDLGLRHFTSRSHVPIITALVILAFLLLEVLAYVTLDYSLKVTVVTLTFDLFPLIFLRLHNWKDTLIRLL